MMKKSLLLLAIAAFALGKQASAQILINEVYPGGGSSTGTPAYTRDFVELYNTSSTAFSLVGLTLQYSAAGATSDFTNTIVAFGAGSIIGPNDYVSIYTGSAGTAGSTLTAGTGPGFVTYVAPTGSSASLSASNGSVRLFNPSTSTILDLVGYGTVTTNTTSGDIKANGTAAATPTSTAVSIDRTNFVNTNNNNADFTSMAPSPNAGTASTVVAAPEPSAWILVACAMGLTSVIVGRRNRAA